MLRTKCLCDPPLAAGSEAPCAFDLWAFYALSSHAAATGDLNQTIKDWLVADDR